MLKSVCLSLLVFGASAAWADTTVDVSKIYGKIQFVDSFPDYKVQVVDSFPDSLRCSRSTLSGLAVQVENCRLVSLTPTDLCDHRCRHAAAPQ